jgi:hypothetical protein
MSYFFQRPEWGFKDRIKRNFFTGLVWFLLLCIPAFWCWLYEKSIAKWVRRLKK